MPVRRVSIPALAARIVRGIIASINQGHIYQFLKKPWLPEDLEAAVHEAAAEYDRLISQAEEVAHLRQELQQLRDRVVMLEQEVVRLRTT